MHRNTRFNIIGLVAVAALCLAVSVPAVSGFLGPLAQFAPSPGDLALLGVGMTTLAADVSRPFELGDRNHLPVIAADIIYEGAAVGDNGSGYARPLVAGDPFKGFCVMRADNSLGAAGAITVEVKQEGRVELAISGLAITDVSKAVYASDDATFTLTATSNSYVGRVIRYVSSGVGMVAFDASKGALGTFVALTDSSGVTAADTIAAIGGTYSQAEVRNAVASLAAKVNAIQKQLA